jgi:anti-anti-sigma factor
MMRPGGPSQPVLISSLVQSETSELSLPDRFDAAFVASSAELWESLGASSRTLLADASHVGFIDSTGVGALIRLRRLLREKDAELILVAPSPSLLRGLELMKLSALFVIATDLEQARARAVQIDSERKAPVQFHRPEQKSHLGWSGDVTASTIDGVWDRTAILLNARTQLDEEMSIDLENVRFLDSAGLGFMVRLRRMARQHGKDLRFVNPSEPVQRVVRLAKLESFLLGGAV